MEDDAHAAFPRPLGERLGLNAPPAGSARESAVRLLYVATWIAAIAAVCLVLIAFGIYQDSTPDPEFSNAPRPEGWEYPFVGALALGGLAAALTLGLVAARVVLDSGDLGAGRDRP